MEAKKMKEEEMVVNQEVADKIEPEIEDVKVYPVFDLCREKFVTADKKEMYNYFVKGEVHGRKIKANIEAKDVGGYSLLDLLFNIDKKPVLSIRDEKMTDERGRKTVYTVYEAQAVDENGEVYPYKVKPSRESDKAYINFMIMQSQKVVKQ